VSLDEVTECNNAIHPSCRKATFGEDEWEGQFK